MDSSKELYLILTDSSNPTLTLGQNIRATTAIATNFRKAYDLALSMAAITEPSLGYRAALEKTNGQYVCQLSNKDGSSKVTIALIKKY
ncbi:MAG: hypothetical protein ACFFKA_00065 [Candidatus Thorarchaeota archaeon]